MALPLSSLTESSASLACVALNSINQNSSLYALSVYLQCSHSWLAACVAADIAAAFACNMSICVDPLICRSTKSGDQQAIPYTPTAKWAALRAIFALAAIEDLELHSLDISNAFLNRELDHEVYMQQPEGFEEYFGAGFVLKLQKALYGLKQAGHQWHRKLDSVMQTMDFKLVRCDNSIWVYQKGDVHIIVPVYVDDMTIASKTTI